VDQKQREELIWAAGFFDGEGYIGIAHQHWKGKLRKQAHAHVSQTDRRPLVRFKAAVGFGKIRERPDVQRKHPTWKRQFRWDISSIANVTQLVQLLLPHLSAPKRLQAQQALAEWKRWKNGQD